MMKKLFIVFATVLLALTGCTEDHLVKGSVSNGKIQASFEESLASRLVVGEGNALTWSSGDAFKMFNEAGSSSIWTLEGTGGTETGVFVGNALEGTLIGAAFPASANPRIEGNTLKMNLQPELMYAPGICNLPMWASFSSLEGAVSFKHLGALLKIDFTDIPEGYNSLTVTTDKAISGTFSADLSQSEPVLQPNANGKNSVKVSFDAIQGTENNDRLFYIPLPVGEYESINVSISDGTQTLSIAEWKNREIKRKKVYLASLTYRVSDATTPTEITEELEDMLDVTANATIEITQQIDAADGSIEIPAEASKVGLNFAELPVTSSASPLKIEEAAATNGAQLTVSIPATDDETYMEFNTPTTTVNVKGGNYKKIVARTAANTLVIGENTTVADLVIVAGNVVIDGGSVVGSITRDVSNKDEVTYIYVNDESELEGVTIGEGIEVVVTQTRPDFVETSDGNYEINSAAGLREFAASVDAGNTYAGKTIKLNRDIDLQNELWTPIGAVRATADFTDIVFQGTLDGQNHAIKNLKIQCSEYWFVGLFASVHGATFKNLTIMNGEVKNQYLAKAGYAGAFVGYSEGLMIVNCHNVNCAVTVERSDNQKKGAAAGLVGYGYEYGDIMPTYIACTNSGTISSPSNPSGIVYGGFGVGANIVACVNTGDVVMTNVTGGGYPAGIVCNFGGSPAQYMYGCFSDCYVTEVATSGSLVADAGFNGSNIHYSYSTNATVRLLGQSWTAMNTTVSVVSSYSECVDNLNAGIEMYNASAVVPCEYRFVAGDVPTLEKK